MISTNTYIKYTCIYTLCKCMLIQKIFFSVSRYLRATTMFQVVFLLLNKQFQHCQRMMQVSVEYTVYHDPYLQQRPPPSVYRASRSHSHLIPLPSMTFHGRLASSVMMRKLSMTTLKTSLTWRYTITPQMHCHFSHHPLIPVQNKLAVIATV